MLSSGCQGVPCELRGSSEKYSQQMLKRKPKTAGIFRQDKYIKDTFNELGRVDHQGSLWVGGQPGLYCKTLP